MSCDQIISISGSTGSALIIAEASVSHVFDVCQALVRAPCQFTQEDLSPVTDGRSCEYHRQDGTFVLQLDM